MRKLISIILVVSLLTTLAACSIDSGTKADSSLPTVSEKAVYTENFSFTKNEMTYLYSYVYGQSYSYLTLFGLDTETSLKEQAYTDEMTWFDYLMTQAIQYAEDFLYFCEEALSQGIELDETERASIASELAAIESSATSAGFKSPDEYLATLYGAELTLAEYGTFIEKTTLAYKMYTIMMESTIIPDDMADSYFADNANQFTTVDYLAYSFTVDQDSGMTDEQALEKAEALALADSEEAFLRGVKASNDALELTDIESTAITYWAGDAFSEWAFSASVKPLDTYVASDSSLGSYTVYMLRKTPYRDETISEDTDGLPAWKYYVIETLKQQAYMETYEALMAKYPIFVENEILEQIEG